jgi:hypothetical protein
LDAAGSVARAPGVIALVAVGNDSTVGGVVGAGVVVGGERPSPPHATVRRSSGTMNTMARRVRDAIHAILAECGVGFAKITVAAAKTEIKGTYWSLTCVQ